MSGFSLTLGPIDFAGFELPSSITVGGRQRLAIHRLPGGLRIIDALGADHADIAFNGIFTGPDAADRARILDALRIAGAALPLAWDAFFYTVVIESFEADYRSPWWIPYRLTCSVLRDEAAIPIVPILSLASSLAADVFQAGIFTDVSFPSAALADPAATTAGTAANTAARSAFGTSTSSLDGSIALAEPGLAATDLLTATAAAAQLARLTAARGYMARASRNLSQPGN
jgi:hypothetical protein